MTRPRRLSPREIESALTQLSGWSLSPSKKLHKEFHFQNFEEAFSFMEWVAIWADEANHHPEWFNVYNRVRVDLTTHDTQPAGGGVSSLDLELAAYMESLITAS